jgi:hypothetical protein
MEPLRLSAAAPPPGAKIPSATSEKMRELRHYITFNPNLEEFALKAGASDADWQAAIFEDISHSGKSLTFEPLPERKGRRRIGLHGKKFYCEANLDRSRDDTLFIFHIQRSRLQSVSLQEYAARFQLLTPRTPAAVLDPIRDLRCLIGEPAEAQVQPSSPLSEVLSSILAQCPDDVRGVWGPENAPAQLESATEFIQAFRKPWVTFRLEAYARLTPRQQSMVNERLGLVQLESRERGDLLGVLDFSMLNSYAQENASKPQAVYGLLKHLAALPLSPALRARVWIAMLAGLKKTALLRKLKESAASLATMRRESPAVAQHWESALLSLIKLLGERERDSTLLELNDECMQRTSPLDCLLEWLETLEFRPESVQALAQVAQQLAKPAAEHAEAEKQKPPAPTSLANQDGGLVTAIGTTNVSKAFDDWVLSLQVPDVGALEATMSEITERLSGLQQELPAGSMTHRAAKLARVLGNLNAEVPKWLESLPNPDTLTSDYQEAINVYQQARQILGNDVDTTILSAKVTPSDLRAALRLVESGQKLNALPEWAWNLEDATAQAQGGEKSKRVWVERLTVPEVRERVIAILDGFREVGEENWHLLPFVPPPEVDGHQGINPGDVKKHVRTWLQEFIAMLAPLPLDLRGQFQSRVTSPMDCKRLTYCAGIFNNLKDRLPLATCVQLLQHLYSLQDIEELYAQADSYLNAVRQMESLMEEAAKEATFNILEAFAKKHVRLQPQPKEGDQPAPSIEILHNWVDLRGTKAPLVYFPDESLPCGSVSVPLLLQTRQNRSWSLKLVVSVRSRHRHDWPSNWPQISPQEMQVKDTAWRRDIQSPGIYVHSFKLRIPIRRNQGQSTGLKFDVTLVDKQTDAALGRSQRFKWDVINDAPDSITPVWKQATDPRYVENHPIGPQRRSKEILSQLCNFGSFAVMAPRRFGKSTLAEYLRLRAQAEGFVVPPVRNCLKTEYLRSSGFDYERFWSDISDNLQNEVFAGINRPLRDGLPEEYAFDHIRHGAKLKESKGVLILIDEAQVFFGKRTGTALGDTLKDRLERYWSRSDEPRLVPIMMGFVGLPSLGERVGANLMGLLFTLRCDELEDDELNRLILSATDRHLHTTREARRELEKSAQNLVVLRALTDKLAHIIFAEQHTWANYDDVLTAEKQLEHELQEGKAEHLAVYVRDALNDAESVNDWVPNTSLALAVALASAREKGVSPANLREEAKSQLRSWCESLKPPTSIHQLGYDQKQFDEHLQVLHERGVLVNDEFSSQLLEAWLLGLKRQSEWNPDAWQKIVMNAAIRRIRLPEPLEKVEDAEGGDAKVWTCVLEGVKYAVRRTSLRTSADRQRFVEEKEVLDQLKELAMKGEPGHEYVFALKEVGLSADDERDAIQLYHWIEGFDLSRKIGHLDGPYVVELGRKLARALVFLHSHGILHRDLRPQNVVLSEQNFDPILIDFGFARRLTWESKTPLNDDWAAPEVRCENPTWTTAADVYGLGKTLRAVLKLEKKNISLMRILDRCCHIQPNERPKTIDLEGLFKSVAGEFHVDAKKEQTWRWVSELSTADRERFQWFEEILDKYRSNIEDRALGGSDQFSRARLVADFLNQVLEASHPRQLNLGWAAKNAEATDGALATEDIYFLSRLRRFQSHGSYRQRVRFLSEFGNPDDEAIRQKVLTGAKQIANHLHLTSLTAVVEAIL